jgi:hypothetical protein
VAAAWRWDRGRPVGAQSAKTQRTSTMAATDSMAAYRQAQGLQRAHSASQRPIRHGRQTKDKLAAQRHAAKVGRRVMGELKRLEQQIVDAGLMPYGDKKSPPNE